MEFCLSWPLKVQPLSYWGIAASKWISFPYKIVPVTQATSASNGGGLVAKSCLPLCDPMDCSPLGSSVHGILQARRMEWVLPSNRRWQMGLELFSM